VNHPAGSAFETLQADLARIASEEKAAEESRLAALQEKSKADSEALADANDDEANYEQEEADEDEQEQE
jgi:hypothetical protein